MGEIRKDNLHESLIEELNELANIDLSGKQDKTDESLLTESKDVIGAINELFQSANNGKELIANAIGEPLNAEDTFSAMSNDINSLLSTFKTNMMNNGIAVESGDKFKQLIDKLISDNTNKEEITYLFNAPDYYNEEFYNDLKTHSTHIEGYSYPVITLKDNVNNGVMSFDMTGSTSSGFTGTNCVLSVFTNNKIDLTNVTSIKIVAKRTSSKAVTSFGIFSQFVSVGHPGHPDFAKYITIATTDSYIEYTLDTTEVIGEHYIGITVTTSNLTNKGKAYVYVQSIMLTSIGKNDALRDSLASILQEEGVDVTEEDDMASLIGKVDEDFDRQVVPAGNAAASNVLSGKTFINSTGSTLTGTMANNGTKTITPKASAQTLGAGYYDKITINGDADLVAANIVSGKNIFGVTGTASIASMGGVKIIPGTEFTFATDKKKVGNVSTTPNFVECLSYTVQFTGSYTVDLYTFTSSSSTYMQCRITVKSSSGTVKSEKTSGNKNNSKDHFTYDFAVNKGDVIIFSYKVISSQINLNNFIYTVSGYLQD